MVWKYSTLCQTLQDFPEMEVCSVSRVLKVEWTVPNFATKAHIVVALVPHLVSDIKGIPDVLILDWSPVHCFFKAAFLAPVAEKKAATGSNTKWSVSRYTKMTPPSSKLLRTFDQKKGPCGLSLVHILLPETNTNWFRRTKRLCLVPAPFYFKPLKSLS